MIKVSPTIVIRIMVSIVVLIRMLIMVVVMMIRSIRVMTVVMMMPVMIFHSLRTTPGHAPSSTVWVSEVPASACFPRNANALSVASVNAASMAPRRRCFLRRLTVKEVWKPVARVTHKDFREACHATVAPGSNAAQSLTRQSSRRAVSSSTGGEPSSSSTALSEFALSAS